MTETRANTLLLMLMAIIILLMIAIAGLFLRMNQLQGQVLATLSGGPVGVPAQDVGLPVGTAAPDFTLPDLAGKAGTATVIHGLVSGATSGTRNGTYRKNATANRANLVAVHVRTVPGQNVWAGPRV